MRYTKNTAMDSTILASLIGVAGTVFGSAAGAFGGAHYAFVKQEGARKQEETEAKVGSAQTALFILGQQANLLTNIRTQFLEKYRRDPARHVRMLPSSPVNRADWRLDLNSLSWLIQSRSADTLLQLLLRDDWFHQTLALLNTRFRIHSEMVQPTMEAAIQSGKLPPAFPVRRFEEILGPRLTSQLRQVTDSLFEFVDEGCEKHAQVCLRFAQEMRELLPGNSFVYFILPQVDSTDTKD